MSELAAFHFLRPWVLLGLPFAWWLAARWRPGSEHSDWARWMDRRLLDALAIKDGAGQKVSWLMPRALMICALSLMILALAGPAWRLSALPTQVPDDALVIVLDLSDEARVSDLSPSRYERARFKLADLLSGRRHGQTALVVYAGEAFTVAPLTDDAQTLQALLPSLSPDLMPVAGQRLDAAIRMAAELINANSQHGQVLVLTNSASANDIAQARTLAEQGLTVSVLALGTRAGAPVPEAGGGFAKSKSGDLRLSTLDVPSLQSLARAGGGRYVELRLDDGDLNTLGVWESSGDGRASLDSEQKSEHFVDDGPWLLLACLPLMALLFRRGWLMLLVLSIHPLPAQAEAESWWQRPDQQAREQFDQGQFDQARELDPDSELAASAAYRAGDFAAAAKLYEHFDTPRAHYNRGNALAKAGQLQQALSAYDQALERAPDMEDAAHNRALVEKALAEQKQQQNGKSDQQKQDQEQESGESSNDQGDQSDSDSDASKQDQSGKQDDQQSSGSEQDDSSKQDGQQSSKQDADQQSGETSQNGEADAEPESAEAEQRQRELEQAQREATEQALRDQASQPEGEQSEQPMIGSDQQPVDPRELEKAQAVEQLLRRVPDDPGALLKRRFALEHRRRVMEGEQQ